MSSHQRQTTSRDKAINNAIARPRPSSSVIVLSPTNEVLLLHRVKSSTSFASAHVFPGGNLDGFHDGDVPSEKASGRHIDGLAYRLAAVRECFEETGILLAKRLGILVELPTEERDKMRKKVHANEVNFTEWVRSLGAELDITGLIPFTRFITPVNVPKRFTTQMYIYLLPESGAGISSEIIIPVADGGVEHTAAQFAPASVWLDRARNGSVTLFTPQFYLLHLLAPILSTSSASSPGKLGKDIATQRKELMSFLARVPTADIEEGKQSSTARIPWREKVMCAYDMQVKRADGRVVLGLDNPGPELEDTGRGGDYDRVVIVDLRKKGRPKNTDVRMRAVVLGEHETTADIQLDEKQGAKL
ncbi:putative NUDIX family hydrolase [Trichoderma austrokoningii]